jgi:hypothetical protein
MAQAGLFAGAGNFSAGQLCSGGWIFAFVQLRGCWMNVIGCNRCGASGW